MTTALTHAKAQVVPCSDVVVVPPKNTMYLSEEAASKAIPPDWTAGPLVIEVFVQVFEEKVQ